MVISNIKQDVNGQLFDQELKDRSKKDPLIVDMSSATIDGVDLDGSTGDTIASTNSPLKITATDDPDEYTESIRPKSFNEIIGRDKEKQMIRMMIESAKKRGDVLDHILFYGPPGLGKTTFAVSIATEVGGSMKITSGPAIERQGDLAAILTNLKQNDILFIDEIHRLNRTIEEILYPAMEDGVIDIVMGKGPSAKTIRLNLEPFTLIGATTQIGKISSPMRERFGLIQRLEYFSDEDLADIVKRAAKIEDIKIDDISTKEIAKRSRGTGRVSLRLFKRVRDFNNSRKDGKGNITENDVISTMEMLGIDEFGLTDVDRRMLWVLYDNYGGGPVGLSTLGAAISEDLSTVSEVYEPFLMKQGLLQRTSRGRMLTQKGLAYVNDAEIELRKLFN